MPDDLYTRDVLIWSDEQSDLLLRLSQGELVNAAIDWPNVIEEIHDVGLSQLNSCKNHLRQSIVHLLKVRGWPHGPVEHWRNETSTFLANAQQHFTPSMRRRIDIDVLYGKARSMAIRMVIDGVPPGPLPERCPFDLDDLLADEPDLVRLLGSS